MELNGGIVHQPEMCRDFFGFPLVPLVPHPLSEVWSRLSRLLENDVSSRKSSPKYSELSTFFFPKCEINEKNAAENFRRGPIFGLRHQCGETWTSVGSAPPDRLHLEDWDTPVIFSANQLIFDL